MAFRSIPSPLLAVSASGSSAPPASTSPNLTSVEPHLTDGRVSSSAYDEEEAYGVRSTLPRKRAQSEEPEAEDYVQKAIVEHFSTVDVALPWHQHFYDLVCQSLCFGEITNELAQTLPKNADGQAKEDFNAAVSIVPWTKAETRALRFEILRFNKQSIQRETGKVNVDDREALHRCDIDWDHIASMPELGRRSAIECKIRWLQQDHPSLNKAKWTKQELQQLCSIAEANNLKDWINIADQLHTGRTAIDCIKQYRLRQTKKIAWTAQEDEALVRGIRLFGENWQSVARMVGRHSNQCINRWTKTVKPLRKGKWTEEEDEDLVAAVEAIGPNWSRVALRMSARSDAQCRERWTNVLNPSINRDDWTKEEDDILREAHVELGNQWGKIAGRLREYLPDNGCRSDTKVMHRIQELERLAQGPRPRARPRKPYKARKKKPVRMKDVDTDQEESEHNLDAESDGDGNYGEPDEEPLLPEDAALISVSGIAEKWERPRPSKMQQMKRKERALNDEETLLDAPSPELAKEPTRTRSGRMTKVKLH